MVDPETPTLADDITAPIIGNRCIDYDEDCEDVPCKLRCWLYDPGQGVCPYLAGEARDAG